MAVQAFVTKHNELLALEREAEIEQSSALLEDVSSKELQRRGVCLLKLHVSNRSTGLYGRSLLTFRLQEGRGGDGSLPVHTFTSGDIVGVGPLHAGPSAHIASGIVSRVGSSFVTVAFDGEQTDSLAVDNGEVYQLTKLANDVTYKRLKRALDSLESYKPGPANYLINVLFGDSEVGAPTRPQQQEEPVQFFNENLDESQREAVQFALSQRDVAIIHGPPGTGKTTTIVEIILQAVRNKMKILACAPSNVAVDNLVERLVVNKARVVRLGHPARLLRTIQKYSLDAILASSDGAKIVQDVRRDIDQTQAKLGKTRDKGERYRLRNESKVLRKELREREKHVIKEVLSHADVVLATNTGATSDGPTRHLPPDHFDLVVIDECAQALEASCWIPLLKGSRCVLAGDHRQLPPTILSHKAASNGLALSLMERLIALQGDKIVRMLTTQYRMHADIMEWSSKELYDGKLKAHESVSKHLLKDLAGVTETEDSVLPVLLIDTAGCDIHELDLEDEMSKGNEGEADLVTLHVESLIESGVDQSKIAVIAPYNLQVDLLRLRLSSRYPKLEIKSVDGFQGREKEAVVISLVRSNKKGIVGFLAEDRRINVAVTRARRHLAIVCDSETVSHHGFLKTLVEYMIATGEVRTAFEYQQRLNDAVHEVSRPDYLVFKQQSSSGPKSAATSSNHTKHGAKSKQPKPKKHDSSSSASSTHRNKNHHQNHKLGDDDTRRGDGDKEDLGDRLEDVPGYTELKKKLEEFVRDDDSAAGRTKLEMPASLTARERYVVHELSERMGLHHCSVGEGPERHIIVSKQETTRMDNKKPQTIEAKKSSKEEEEENIAVSVKDLKNAIIELETENKMSVLADLDSEDTQEIAEDNKPRTANKTSLNTSRDAKEDDGLLACRYCRIRLPPGNHLLHEINCERVHEEKMAKAKRQAQKKKIDKSKQKQRLERTEEDDFDTLIAMAKKSDNVCNFVKCKAKISALGQLCQFCNKRYCFSHHLPEVHGCGDMARANARRVTRKEGVVNPGSGKKERKVDPALKASLERKMGAKLGEMGQKRQRKSAGKKK